MSQPNKSRKILLGVVSVLSIVLAALLVLLLLLENGILKPNEGTQPEQTTTTTQQTDVLDSTAASEQTTTATQQTDVMDSTATSEQTTTATQQTDVMDSTAASEQTTPTEQTAHTKPAGTVPTEAEPSYEDVRVQTGYCELRCSGQWEDSIRTERITEDFAETVLFYGTAEGEETLLFAVYFATATDNSIPVGVYVGQNGVSVDVSAELFELMTDGLTDEGFDALCAMQEQVNYVIEKLNETDGFTPAQ